MSTAIEVDHPLFQLYSSGVLTVRHWPRPRCSGRREQNRLVLITGSEEFLENSQCEHCIHQGNHRDQRWTGGEFWSRHCVPGKTGSRKKFYHIVISGADFAAQPYYVAIIIPVIHFFVAVWKLMKIQQAWDRIQSQFQSLDTAEEAVGGTRRQLIG